MKILIDIMNYLLKILEAELISATPEIIEYIEKEVLILIENLKEIIDSKK